MYVDEKKYLEELLAPIRKCKNFRPRFSFKEGSFVDACSLSDYRAMFSIDPFAGWIGLNQDRMYAAHRTAGAIAELHHQLRLGCSRLLRAIFRDATQCKNHYDSGWRYKVKTKSGTFKSVNMDARLSLDKIRNDEVRTNVRSWMINYCRHLNGSVQPPRGVVFDVHHGYTTDCLKTPYANIDNATVAWANGYLPIVAVFSNSYHGGDVNKMFNSRCGILTGSMHSDPNRSLFAFCQSVIGYNLGAFLSDYAPSIHREIDMAFEALMDPNFVPPEPKEQEWGR